MPHCPYFLDVKGLGISGPGLPCRTTISPLPVSGCPAYLFSAGFGSKVSTWLTPPLINSEITLLARGVKCGGLGASGLATGFESPVQATGSDARRPSWSSNDKRPSPLIPPQVSNKNFRRDVNATLLPHVQKLVQVEQHIRQIHQLMTAQKIDRQLLFLRVGRTA